MAAQRWRVSRAALYGAALGAFLRLVGIIPATPEPPGIVLHWAYVAGQCIATALVLAILFLIVAIIRNLIVRAT